MRVREDEGISIAVVKYDVDGGDGEYEKCMIILLFLDRQKFLPGRTRRWSLDMLC